MRQSSILVSAFLSVSIDMTSGNNTASPPFRITCTSSAKVVEVVNATERFRITDIQSWGTHGVGKLTLQYDLGKIMTCMCVFVENVKVH